MIVVALVLTLERLSRGRKRYHHTTGHLRYLPSWKLSPLKSLMAIGACLIPLTLGFITIGLLLKRALHHGDVRWQETVTSLAANSFVVSAIAAALVLVAAFIIVFVARLLPTR